MEYPYFCENIVGDKYIRWFFLSSFLSISNSGHLKHFRWSLQCSRYWLYLLLKLITKVSETQFSTEILNFIKNKYLDPDVSSYSRNLSHFENKNQFMKTYVKIPPTGTTKQLLAVFLELILLWSSLKSMGNL